MHSLVGLDGRNGHIAELGASSPHDLMKALLVVCICGITGDGGRSYVVRPTRFEFDEEDIIFLFGHDPLLVDFDLGLIPPLSDEFAGPKPNSRLEPNAELCIRTLVHRRGHGWTAHYQVVGPGGFGDIKQSLHVGLIFDR